MMMGKSRSQVESENIGTWVRSRTLSREDKDKFCSCLWNRAYHDKKCRFNCANKLIELNQK
jgi:hypothetical protein